MSPAYQSAVTIAPPVLNRRLRRQKKAPSRSRGYLLVGTSVALALAAGIIVLGVNHQNRTAQIARNTAQGSQAAQFAVGMRGYIAHLQQDRGSIGTKKGYSSV